MFVKTIIICTGFLCFRVVILFRLSSLLNRTLFYRLNWMKWRHFLFKSMRFYWRTFRVIRSSLLSSPLQLSVQSRIQYTRTVTGSVQCSLERLISFLPFYVIFHFSFSVAAPAAHHGRVCVIGGVYKKVFN